MAAKTVIRYVMMTRGVPSMSARGMTRCGFSISPASVDIDSHPEYIHIMIASPRLRDVSRVSPGLMTGLNGLPEPERMPQTVNTSSGAMTPIWMIVSVHPVSSSPRMLMKVKIATIPMPMSARSAPPKPHFACM